MLGLPSTDYVSSLWKRKREEGEEGVVYILQFQSQPNKWDTFVVTLTNVRLASTSWISPATRDSQPLVEAALHFKIVLSELLPAGLRLAFRTQSRSNFPCTRWKASFTCSEPNLFHRLPQLFCRVLFKAPSPSSLFPLCELPLLGVGWEGSLRPGHWHFRAWLQECGTGLKGWPTSRARPVGPHSDPPTSSDDEVFELRYTMQDDHKILVNMFYLFYLLVFINK